MKEETSTRDTLARLFDEGGVTDDTLADDAGEPEAPAAEPPEPKAEAAEPKAAKAPAKAPAAKAGERQRGPDGKFVPVADVAPVATEAAKPAAVAPEAEPALKPPADWRPAAKEKWATLPREVQEESIRLHTEIKKTLQDSAQARQMADTFQRTVAPYEHMFRAAGRTPVEGVGWLVQQYAALQTAPLAQRAAIIAGLQRDFIGTDESAINMLASALEGRAAPASSQQPGSMRPEQVQQMVRQQLEQERAQSAYQSEAKAITDFESSAPEFLTNVTKQMLAVLTLEKQQGKAITPELLKSAYDQALRMNPETAAILKQRDDAAAAEKAKGEAGRRAAAASGIKTEPAGPSAPSKPLTTREQVAQEFAKARSRSRV